MSPGSDAQTEAPVDEHIVPAMMPRESPHHGYRGEQPTPSAGFAPRNLTIAISREAGARGGTIGRRIGRALGWPVYDQELLEFVLQDGTVDQDIGEGLGADAAEWVERRLSELAAEGLHAPDTIATMARVSLVLGARGNVVLIGRGAGYLLPRRSTLHVRLIAPLEDRIAYMAQWLRLTVEEARQRVRVRDARRGEFLTTYLRKQPGEVHSYDLILNTSSFGEELSTDLIVQAARAKETLLRNDSPNRPAGES
jgi:cytidylate kinase